MTLDIIVFRGFVPTSAQESINEQRRIGYELSMKEAIEHLNEEL